MQANELRRAYTDFFSQRGHTVVPSASLIPHDPTVLFTVAGMVPFKPYFVGDEVPPYKRAVSVQKSARAGGKHNDLDDVGRTKRHLVFFEMMGNFSFGDYFKTDAIPWSWDLVTNVFGLDGDRIWVTVHESDDEAEAIWHEQVGVPMNRIQRLGDKDNFWQMGDTGPCGPCSELHIDRGAAFGPDGGPLNDPGGDRFMEFWNLVFMQYNQAPDGSRTLLPKPSIDTGAGLERILTLLQGVDSVWETDLMMPLIDQGQSLTGKTYRVGDYDHRESFSLRVLAEHARSSAMLVTDGVFPSNEGRGYVLRRIIRRAVRHAYLLGTEKLVMPSLVETAISVMADAYPEVARQRDFIVNVIGREEERFRHTLKTGLSILDTELEGAEALSGNAAFKLHDTFGFPLEVTEEIVAERGLTVDRAGFDTEMAEQRRRAKDARKAKGAGVNVDEYRALTESHGLTEFTGRVENTTQATVLAVFDTDQDTVEIVLDRTPFYAESGGQTSDTGTITTASGLATVLETNYAMPGLVRHIARVTAGEILVGDTAAASIDAPRRAAIKRNHTGTHILHWALRETLGDHVKQAGSLVDSDRLRFDFSHYEAVTPAQIVAIENLANEAVLSNPVVTHNEMTKAEAEALGAVAFFGDKYGDTVRVLSAGPSLEFCGGTHVSALGDIGLIKIISEGSIGSNLRRIEATTGMGSLERLRASDAALANVTHQLNAKPGDELDSLARKLDEIKTLKTEITGLRKQLAGSGAADLVAKAVNGVVIERVDGMDRDDLRNLAVAVRDHASINAVVLIGAPLSGGVALVGAAHKGSGYVASDLIAAAAKLCGGGGGKAPDLAVAGGRNSEAIDEALVLARAAAGL